MSDTSLAAAPEARLRDDATTISLVGLAHGTSHFFHLLLPPLFPLFIRDFGLSYAELGLLVSTFFVISGVGQALAGFVVDRVGARPVLMLAMCSFAAAGVAAALAPGYGGLMLAVWIGLLVGAPLDRTRCSLHQRDNRVRTVFWLGYPRKWPYALGGHEKDD